MFLYFPPLKSIFNTAATEILLKYVTECHCSVQNTLAAPDFTNSKSQNYYALQKPYTHSVAFLAPFPLFLLLLTLLQLHCFHVSEPGHLLFILPGTLFSKYPYSSLLICFKFILFTVVFLSLRIIFIIQYALTNYVLREISCFEFRYVPEG